MDRDGVAGYIKHMEYRVKHIEQKTKKTTKKTKKTETRNKPETNKKANRGETGGCKVCCMVS